MITVLMGAPGAGKGTQAALLAQKFGWKTFSTGDALRKQVALGTPLGKEIEEVMSSGGLVSDGKLFEVVSQELRSHNRDEVIILDGYPRTLNQAKMLQSLRQVQPVTTALYIQVKRQTLISRLGGREICQGCGAVYHQVTNPASEAGVCDQCGGALSRRSDDEATQIDTRLRLFADETEPVMGYYDALGLSQYVDGEDDSNIVFERICEKVSRKGEFDA